MLVVELQFSRATSALIRAVSFFPFTDAQCDALARAVFATNPDPVALARLLEESIPPDKCLDILILLLLALRTDGMGEVAFAFLALKIKKSQ